jgi:carboxyl-terminal processing protease
VKAIAPMSSTVRTLPLLAALSLVLCSATAIAQPPPISRIDRQRVQDMLRQVRDDIEKNYYDPTFRGIDLDDLFDKARTALAQAPTLNDAYAILTDTVMRFDDSHTVCVPPGRNLTVEYGWRMAMIGSQPLIVEVTRDSDASRKGLQVGDLVLAVNRFTPERDTMAAMRRYYAIIRPQKIQHVVVRKPDGQQLAVDVESKLNPARFLNLTDLLNQFDTSEAELRHRSVAVNQDVLLWKMPAFRDAGPVEEQIRKARGFKTLVLDMRGNGGGSVDTLNTMISWFFDREVVVATQKERKKETTFRAKPRRDRYQGRVIVLVDSQSGSAAEVFARVIQLEKRGTVVGDRTAGAVMTGRIFSHAIGADEQMVFFATMVTVADVRMSDGASLEKTGVQPDELSLPTPADLAAGRDPVLARALSLAGVTIDAEAAARLIK